MSMSYRPARGRQSYVGPTVGTNARLKRIFLDCTQRARGADPGSNNPNIFGSPESSNKGTNATIANATGITSNTTSTLSNNMPSASSTPMSTNQGNLNLSGSFPTHVVKTPSQGSSGKFGKKGFRNHDFIEDSDLSNLVMTYDDFFKAMQGVLELDLDDQEIHRIWSTIDNKHKGEITYEQFWYGVTHRKFLKNILSAIVLKNNLQEFTIPKNYDYSKPTCENYRMGTEKFFGEFAAIRGRLDYSFHSHYTKERSDWQDNLVRLVVTKTNPLHRPWLIFSAGIRLSNWISGVSKTFYAILRYSCSVEKSPASSE